MPEAFPRSNFTGIDNHEGAIEVAKTTNAKWSNLEFLVLDAANIKDKPEFYQRFNYVKAFDAIHDQTHPLDALKGIFHMTAPGGLFFLWWTLKPVHDTGITSTTPWGRSFIRSA
jgi:SAM-dependent methyltransferase